MNGTRTLRKLEPGVYVPTVCFFDEKTEDLDTETIAKHAVRLAKAGLKGITTQGSNGEAVHLTHSERKTVTEVTRKALDDAGFHDFPIIAGCGAQSVREAVELCKEACSSGADAALILPPSYYKPMYGPNAFVEFFQDVASESPIPVLIYNYPGAVSGVDLDSDTLIKLAKHPNIIGCKLTCGNTGKLNRIATTTNAVTPGENRQGFLCMGGSADFTLQTLVAGGSGIIAGLGNVCPKSCVKIIDLYKSGKTKEAREMQNVVARGDWGVIAGGIVGTKSALDAHFGYGGISRRPLPKASKEEHAKHADALKELVEVEKSL